MQSLVLPLYAGCGDTVPGAAEGDGGDMPMDEESMRRREELARAALLYAGNELLDYSEEEEGEEGKSKDEEEMDVDGKEVQKERNEVFLSPEEEAKARAAAAAEAAAAMVKAASMEDAKRARERRRKEEQERNERRKEEARLASELGRELGRKAVKSKVDNRYHAVRSIRSARQAGRELNRAVGPGSPVDSGLGCFLGDDERWFRNYNIHNVERGVNVSCSFNPRSGPCYTCLGEPHKAWEGKEGQPVVLVLSDQCFPANVPAADGGECLRVLRVEDGSMHELTAELLLVLKRWMVVPGMVIMLGSMTQLARYGTAWYAGEWIKARNLLRTELGDVLVVPVLPLVGSVVENTTLVRSLTEFLHWVDDLQDPEMELLRGVRRQYVEEFLCKVEDGEPWAEELQNLMMPISLYSEGLMLYKSRHWGSLPTGLRQLDEHDEERWVGKIGTAMCREINISLATSVASGRTLATVRSLEENNGQMIIKVAGASNAARTTVALTRKGVAAEKVGQRGWSLAVEKDVKELVSSLKGVDMTKQVLLFHSMDNGVFFSMDRNGGSSLPRKISNAYHIPGRLVVASGYALEMMAEQMAYIAKETKPGLVVVITPMPRYLDPCCAEHNDGRLRSGWQRTEESY